MLTKHQIAGVLADQGYGGKTQIANILDGLSDLCLDEIEAGEDFSVPGIVKIAYKYRKPQAKGERWAAGDEVAGFGGVVSVKETASPEVKARIALGATPNAKVKALVPKPNDKAAQRAFLSKKVGKAIATRKGK
jgi:nucleoid DNA-binding protein